VNEDAARSLAEGLEETLTLHRPGVAETLGGSLGTTNCLESILSHVERRVRRVSRWASSHQKPRWLAAAFWTWNPGCNGCEDIGLSGSYELPCGEPQGRSLTEHSVMHPGSAPKIN
jgi:hypothetical protein